jgi:hypothetical protein
MDALTDRFGEAERGLDVVGVELGVTVAVTALVGPTVAAWTGRFACDSDQGLLVATTPAVASRATAAETEAGISHLRREGPSFLACRRLPAGGTEFPVEDGLTAG